LLEAPELKKPSFLTVLLLTPLPALAQQACPTAADLDRGIRVTFADGGVETYRNAGPGVVHVVAVETDGSGAEMDLGQGIHLLSWQATSSGVADPSTRQDYNYNGVAPADLPRPSPGGKGWSSPVTVTAPDGTYDEPQRHSYGPLTAVTVGQCSYQSIEVTISYATQDNYREMVRYIPDLGLGWLEWNEADGMERLPVAATAITRAGK
jgi:hypothetical protein